jgi:hypothetical protein
MIVGKLETDRCFEASFLFDTIFLFKFFDFTENVFVAETILFAVADAIEFAFADEEGYEKN